MRSVSLLCCWMPLQSSLHEQSGCRGGGAPSQTARNHENVAYLNPQRIWSVGGHQGPAFTFVVNLHLEHFSICGTATQIYDLCACLLKRGLLYINTSLPQ